MYTHIHKKIFQADSKALRRTAGGQQKNAKITCPPVRQITFQADSNTILTHLLSALSACPPKAQTP